MGPESCSDTAGVLDPTSWLSTSSGVPCGGGAAESANALTVGPSCERQQCLLLVVREYHEVHVVLWTEDLRSPACGFAPSWR